MNNTFAALDAEVVGGAESAPVAPQAATSNAAPGAVPVMVSVGAVVPEPSAPKAGWKEKVAKMRVPLVKAMSYLPRVSTVAWGSTVAVLALALVLTSMLLMASLRKNVELAVGVKQAQAAASAARTEVAAAWSHAKTEASLPWWKRLNNW